MKRSQQAVPKADTGAIRGDGNGSQGMTMPQGGRNTSVGEHGRGGALAKPGRSVSSSPTGKSGSAGSFTPVQNNAMANLANKRVGQAVPDTSAAATKKPNRKGGSAFYGES